MLLCGAAVVRRDRPAGRDESLHREIATGGEMPKIENPATLSLMNLNTLARWIPYSRPRRPHPSEALGTKASKFETRRSSEMSMSPPEDTSSRPSTRKGAETAIDKTTSAQSPAISTAP